MQYPDPGDAEEFPVAGVMSRLMSDDNSCSSGVFVELVFSDFERSLPGSWDLFGFRRHFRRPFVRFMGVLDNCFQSSGDLAVMKQQFNDHLVLVILYLILAFFLAFYNAWYISWQYRCHTGYYYCPECFLYP